MSVNKVILLGNVCSDPDVRYAPSGDTITTIRLATNRRWKDKNGEKKEESEFHRVVFFGGLAKIAGEYLKKGSQIYVSGRIRTQKWQGQDGQDRYTTEIIAEEMNMLPKSGSGSGGNQSAPNGSSNSQPVPSNNDGFDDFDDSLPF